MTKFDEYTKARKASVRKLMRKEFTDFFVAMTTATGPQWPSVPESEFVDAIADALFDMAQKRGKGIAYTQTLVHELQDRINNKILN